MEKGINNRKLETVSDEMINHCIKNGLTISEMDALTMIFPKVVRNRISEYENTTVFTLNSVQDASK